MSTPRPRPEIAALNDYTPGKSIRTVCETHGLERAMKLASNENPLGPPAGAVRAVEEALSGVHRYPEGNAPELTREVAEFLGVSPDRLVFSNGSDEMIQMVSLAWIPPGGEAVISEPTFSEYRFAVQLAGGVVKVVPMKGEGGEFDLEGILGAIGPETRIVFLCNPNNPTGTWIGRREMNDFLDRVPPGVLVVVDQAYGEFAPAAGAADYPDLLDRIDRPNLLLLRTFSKVFGLAGLRIGYAIGAPELIQILYKVKQPFNLGNLSQAAAIGALRDRDHYARTLETVRTGLELLQSNFDLWGWEHLPTAANFIAFRPKEGSGESLVATLESRGVILRWLKSFGMPEWIRISVGTVEENRRFAEEAERWREEQSG